LYKYIKAFFYDFDGVMTDNTVSLDENGVESVRVNRSDGLAVSELTKRGFLQYIFSTEKNLVVSVRAKKLEIPCLQGLEDKKFALLKYCSDHKINPKECAFVGNDINDLEVMQEAGFSFCPADAHSSIQETSDIVLETRGGHGVIREILDLIIEKKIINK
jgi:3-deoxy-D-manno-octulosonate 8-phosphate phosphatase (KDO 8-P phosphatase)